MNNLVKYHNDFNQVNFSKYSEYEQNLLFKILLEVKEKGAQVIEIPYTDLMVAFNGQFKNNVEIGEYLLTLRDSFFKTAYTMTTPKNERGLVGFTTFLLFTRFTFFYDEPEKKPKSQWTNFETLEVRVNPDFLYLINDLTKNFTTFELSEFIAINGKYTKSLYRLLKQYRTQGVAPLQPMPIDEFRRIMGISKNYNLFDIERRILKPAIKELSEPTLFNQVPFHKLQCLKFDKNKKPVSDEVIKELDEKTKKRRRRTVKFIQFIFTPEKNSRSDSNTTIPTTTETIDVVVNATSKQISSDNNNTKKELELKQFVDNLNEKYKYKELIYNGKKEICINFEFDSFNQDVIVFFENGSTAHVKNIIDFTSKFKVSDKSE